MNRTTNMLSAKKVKLHGMQSSKWTTKDKITQYKGLINLYTRDRKIIEVDTNVTRKKLQRELTALRKSVETDRLDLDNAIKGDRQRLHNLLSDHKEIRLAFHNNFSQQRLTEHVHQLNFTKRKALDKILYANDVRMHKLMDLKQEQSVLEDRLKYAYFLDQIKQDKEAQIITGKVQDALLKKESATAIKHIYIEIINIMKKDALYYDTILTTLENDGFNQNKCFLGGTTLGQLATEYLDDRRQEYNALSKIVIHDMAKRKKDIKQLEEQLKKATDGLKDLLRRDSDLNLCDVHLPYTCSMELLRQDIGEMEKTLVFLKKTTLVNSYEAIFPCLTEQLNQKRRLRIMAKKCERSRDILLNKLNHAQLMSSVLENTMIDTTFEYKKHKKELLCEIEQTKKNKISNLAQIEYKINSTADLRIALRQLLQLSKHIKMDEDLKKVVKVASFESELLSNQAPVPPEKDETDALEMIPILIKRFTYLMSSFRDKVDDAKLDEPYKMFEALMREKIVETVEAVDKKISDTFLLEGIFLEASQQATREDIKKQSEEIYAANTKNEDLIPVFVAPKKSKFLKKKK